MLQLDVEARPEVRALTAETEALATAAIGYQVATTGEYEAAAAELTRIKGTAKKLDELRKSLTKPLDEAKARIMDFFRAPAERLANAERDIKRAMVAFDEEQERQRREAQRRADEEARKARQEAERAAAEARRKAEEEAAELRRRAAAEAEAGRAAEAAKLAARAEQKVERAESKAEQLEQQASAVVAPLVTTVAPQTTGIASREVWKFVIEDPSKLPREFLVPDEKAIGGVVRAMKGNTSIPGVRVYAEKQIAARAASV